MADLMESARAAALADIDQEFDTFLEKVLPIYKKSGAAIKGGPGSGNFGHSGRPGHRGGSGPRQVAPQGVTDEMKALGVSAITDTKTAPDQDLGGAGIIEDKTLIAWHVTDNPDKVTQALRDGVDLQDSAPGYHPELGQGLYASGVPEYWMGRSTGKYNFLNTLDAEGKGRLAQHLRNDLDRLRGRHITENEYSYGMRSLKDFEENGVNMAVVNLAGQPFNLRFWKPEWLADRGFKPGKQPEIVEIHARGKFAQMERQPKEDEVTKLRRLGFDGAYLRSSFSHDPQVVIWNRKAVRQFGGWEG